MTQNDIVITRYKYYFLWNSAMVRVAHLVERPLQKAGFAGSIIETCALDLQFSP